jgi:hypothetical protein
MTKICVLALAAGAVYAHLQASIKKFKPALQDR